MRNLGDENISVLISCLSLPIWVRGFGKVSVVCAPGTWVHHDPRSQQAIPEAHVSPLLVFHEAPFPTCLPSASPRPVCAQTQPSPASVKNDTGSLSAATSHSHPAPSCENPFLDIALTEPGSVCTLAPRPLPSFIFWSTCYPWAHLCSEGWPVGYQAWSFTTSSNACCELCTALE